MWVLSRATLLAESSYAHTENCQARVIPIRQLVDMTADEALAEIARLNGTPGEARNRSRFSPPYRL
ncbi:hypothetical protein [Streptomyces sp. NPDC054804]